jgi:predicted nucleotide-binding protein
LARRLEQRNALITNIREKIRVFVISSAEALAIARGIETAFDYDSFHVKVWIPRLPFLPQAADFGASFPQIVPL